ncbi:uncharacterized protein Nmag_1610 [Natrialba magadii ATCC 43099]|uniref:Uncharacterized protein n=1 Tax=Natrialba magadii (strain ATCC 43099 / DSM 3394 / CCM 3739 / CIP 104546 / IAM 13178 / JCM 8861 / NBRC 102185 / NCIMB 2190 / MS3) TaxID=547559 RepID=D3SUC8_NATMM|nr:hypothetical protein [Natrialba magadii]ADD05186.1 uncharacterized protein Nmag_1610 [Natrialba magadii ATCC 43099]ELY23224.1 hypothetical protein C500_20581 [Natrialba magadii ATCC 43099]
MLARVQFALAKAIGYAICEPKLRLGRRRHDNHCDECGEHCGRYYAQKLEFTLGENPETSTSRAKLRAMWNAEYVRVCLECSVKLETESENSTRTEGGEQA